MTGLWWDSSSRGTTAKSRRFCGIGWARRPPGCRVGHTSLQCCAVCARRKARHNASPISTPDHRAACCIASGAAVWQPDHWSLYRLPLVFFPRAVRRIPDHDRPSPCDHCRDLGPVLHSDHSEPGSRPLNRTSHASTVSGACRRGRWIWSRAVWSGVSLWWRDWHRVRR